MTLPVDAGFADWLRNGILYAPAIDAGIGTKWGDLATETEIGSPLAEIDGAAVEAARQLIFLAGPLVEDVAIVPGLRADLVGRCITLVFDGLGYAAGKPVFVIAAEEAETTHLTTLTILRAL